MLRKRKSQGITKVSVIHPLGNMIEALHFKKIHLIVDEILKLEGLKTAHNSCPR